MVFLWFSTNQPHPLHLRSSQQLLQLFLQGLPQFPSGAARIPALGAQPLQLPVVLLPQRHGATVTWTWCPRGRRQV